MFCYFAAPSFCNASWPFDVKVLKDIRGDMDTYWPDIEVATHGIFTDSCNKFFLWLVFFGDLADHKKHSDTKRALGSFVTLSMSFVLVWFKKNYELIYTYYKIILRQFCLLKPPTFVLFYT